jgi:putative tricarboxylic transport membrane protein
MRKLDAQQISSLLWLMFSIIFCVGAIELQVGIFSQPGPGLMPLLIGIFMGIMSIIAIVRNLFTKRESDQGKTGDGLSLANLKKPMIVCASILAYGLILDPLGYLISTFLLMFFLFKAIEPQRWVTATVLTVLTVSVSYLVFEVWLGCQFPTFLK